MMLALIRPKFFIPVHGEYRMLVKHAEIGKEMGVAPKNVLIAENGSVIEITKVLLFRQLADVDPFQRPGDAEQLLQIQLDGAAGAAHGGEDGGEALQTLVPD